MVLGTPSFLRLRIVVTTLPPICACLHMLLHVDVPAGRQRHSAIDEQQAGATSMPPLRTPKITTRHIKRPGTTYTSGQRMLACL